GGCSGDRVVCALTLLKMQLDALKENIDTLFIATCIMNFCPHRDEIIATAKEKSGVEVIVWEHRYALPQIFKG
ncbi:MAG: CGGC domain-containing protein, partial [Thermodesulfobium narugense]